MTLRARLLAAAAAVTLLLVVVLTGIVVRQRAILTHQLFVQLQTVASAIGRGPVVLAETQPLLDRQPDGPLTGDIYLAVVGPAGGVQVIAQPVSYPGFAPDLTDLDLTGGGLEAGEPVQPIRSAETGESATLVPFTIDSISGPGRARTIAVDVGSGRTVIVARSTDRIDEAQQQLIVASTVAVLAVVGTLGLALWWVDRLGLQPINRLTAAAEDVAAGRSDRRVRHPPSTTETGRLGVAFNTMLDARQEAEERQRRFVADASHELRTPLTTLRGYAALHASGGLPSDESVDDAMCRIRNEADRMSALVEDLLTLASLDEDRPLDLGPVDLSQLLIDIGSDAAAIQPDRPVDSEAVAPGLIVRADQHLLTQALTAVTTNALHHTSPEAGLTLTARRITAGSTPDRIIVTVADRGQGIAPDQLPHLFDRFYRADPGRAALRGGRGLGLSITRTVIEAHGGTVTASSDPGRGTEIAVEMPSGSV